MALTRREFLRCSAVASLALLPCGRLLANTAWAAAAPANYYLAHKAELTAAFAGGLRGAAQFLAPEFGDKRAQEICRQAMGRFGELLPALPEVGGERNWDTQFLPIAAWYVALYGPLRESGKTAEDVGKLVYDLNSIDLGQVPRAQALAEQERLFGQAYTDMLREWAAWTQKREHPGNWVAEFIEGDGEEFDYGIYYSECALVKYFRAQGAPELAPYVCLNDFTRSKAYGTGLWRTKTLAGGDGVCNFQYRKGRPVTQDWSTEIGKIRAEAGR
jgi:hypothetical protein